MACETYRETNFRPETLGRIGRINEVLSEYDQQLTARQVYYQFVARGWLENTERNYKNMTSLLADARYAGLVDWEAIEDRGREPSIPLQFRDLQHRIDSAITNYRLDRWEGQENYVELWVEKQALAGVLQPLATKFHVSKLALTMAQIREFNPPPNPAKVTDSRARAYIDKYGPQSWELDALPPRELTRLIEQAFKSVLDEAKMAEVVKREKADKQKLRSVLK